MFPVIPAKAGIHAELVKVGAGGKPAWIPACAGMTD
jgi:hypothetical protein